MHGFEGWYMGSMWFWWILILLLVGVAVWVATSYSRRDRSNPGETPEQTLKRRFAKGEIDREQYDRMLSDLRK